MAIDPNAPPAPAPTISRSAIENEFPTYRAISKLSVASFILGLVSLLSFADFWFLPAGVAAIVLGILAEWKIRKLPEVLTGRGFAQFGIALGMIFGLSSVTISVVQSVLRARDATNFAGIYIKTLKTGTVEDAMWYLVPPLYRRGVPPAKLVEGLKKSSPEAFAKHSIPLQQIKARLAAAPGEDLRFVKLEEHGDESLVPYAFALLALEGPGSKEFPKKREYILLRMRGLSDGKIYHWWIDFIKYPYQPGTHVPEPKPIDDGHDHSHGA